MKDIVYEVNQQRIIALTPTRGLYRNTDNFIRMVFRFSADWAGCVKGIVFLKDTEEIPVMLKNDSVTVSEELTDDDIRFYIVGKKKGYRIQTQEKTLKLEVS